MTISRILLMTTPLILAGIGTVAQAESPLESRNQIVVNHDDLNLSSPKGQATLKTRIRMAIRDVCLYSTERDLNKRAKTQKCMDTAKRDADEQLARLFKRNDSQFAAQDVKFGFAH